MYQKTLLLFCVLVLMLMFSVWALAQEMMDWPDVDLRSGGAVHISADSENVELVGRWPFGQANDVHTVDSYAYLGLYVEKGLAILDVRDPSHPTEVGRVNTPGAALGVYVSGAYAYVADGSAGLRVIDVSDPANPHEAGFYDTLGSALGVRVSGDFAYLADRSAGLYVLRYTCAGRPVADANGPYAGMVGEAIIFDGTGSYDPDGQIVCYDWTFGDGAIAEDAGPTPDHTYAEPGTYTVTLTVTDNDGLTDTDNTTATAEPVSPHADANGPYTGKVGEPITFDGTGSYDTDGEIVRYDWTFGDGSVKPDAGPTPVYTYSEAGTYPVTLTVTDNHGLTDTDVTTATVEPASECPIKAISSQSVVEELYQFRDGVLAKNEAGRGLIQLYYEHSPEVAGILFRHPQLSVRSAAILTDVVPGIRFLLGDKNGVDMEMNRLLVYRIQKLFADIGKQGSGELAEAMSMLSNILDDCKGMRVSRIWRSVEQ